MKYLKHALLLGLAGLILWGVYFIVSRQGGAITPPLNGATTTENAQQTTVPQPPTPPFSADTLQQSLKDLANSYPMLDTGVVVLSTTDDTASTVQGDAPFIAASTTKVIVATYALHQVQNGAISLDDYIAGRTLKEQITRMIVNSDNTAWYALLEHFGYTSITAYGNQNGAPSFDAVKNTITPFDMSIFIKNMHNQSSINAENVAFLEGLMAQSNTGTISLAPEFLDIIRKAGWLADRQHLVGVITANNKTVVYAIYTKSTGTGGYTYAKGSAFINEALRTITTALQ